MTPQRRGSRPAVRWRVVLDTNVVVSALLFTRGPAVRVREAWHAGQIVPLASRATVDELVRVLANPKFRLSADDQAELLADYLPLTTVVTVREPPPVVPRCRDPHDQPFLHQAAAGRAHALVTGDEDLLALAGQTRWRILTVAALLDHFSAPAER
jgi:putative PIN family toxin of toxin-antitoxin system